MKPQAKPKRPWQGVEQAPLWLSLFLRQSRQSTLQFCSLFYYCTVLTWPDPPMHNDARLFGIVTQRLPAKAVFVVFATTLRIDFPPQPQLEAISTGTISIQGTISRTARPSSTLLRPMGEIPRPGRAPAPTLFSQLHSSTRFPLIAESSTVPQNPLTLYKHAFTCSMNPNPSHHCK